MRSFHKVSGDAQPTSFSVCFDWNSAHAWLGRWMRCLRDLCGHEAEQREKNDDWNEVRTLHRGRVPNRGPGRWSPHWLRSSSLTSEQRAGARVCRTRAEQREIYWMRMENAGGSNIS